jgi:hypothetical protein
MRLKSSVCRICHAPRQGNILSCCWHSYHSPTVPWLCPKATHTAGTPPVSIVLGRNVTKYHCHLCGLLRTSCQARSNSSFYRSKVFYSPPYTVIIAMSVKSLCLAAHISNVLKYRIFSCQRTIMLFDV